MSVSIVIPIYNEVENIRPMYEALQAVIPQLGRRCEIVFVDDGSQDGSHLELQRLAKADPAVKVIEFRGNFGQTSAMAPGIRYASGDVVVTLDGDLQNDPADIPMMLEQIEAGYDCVHGWRKNRQDALLNRKLPSRCANWLISRVTGFPVHDLGCTLKAIRRELAQELPLYGEMHRFIPILAAWRGGRCVEVVTRHHPRRFGVSKYGISRTIRVLLDLITVKYLIRYLASPMKLFGLVGLGCLALGGVSGMATLGMKIWQQVDMTGNPLLLLCAFSWMAGIQFLMLGMLGELGARIYYGTGERAPFAVRSTINFDAPPADQKLPQVHRKAA